MKKVIENTLSIVAGFSVEVTVRGERKFTFSFEGRNDLAVERIKKYFKGQSIRVDYDEECDYTCLYATF
jgi:hypothetical protein